MAARADALAGRVARGVPIPRSAILREALHRGLADLEREAELTPGAPVPPGERYIERDPAAVAAAQDAAL